MNRRALWTVVGLVIPILVVEVVLSAASPHLPAANGMPSAATRYKLSAVTHDAALADTAVLFVGTSVTEAAIDPAILEQQFGLDAFNGAMPFGTPLANEVWIDDFLDPGLHPQTVVVGLPTWTTRTTYETDRMRRSLEAAGAARGSLVSQLLSNSELLSRQGLLLEPSELFAEVRALKAGLWTPRGHQTVFYRASGAAVTVDQAIQEEGPVYSTENLEALKRLVDDIRDEGRQVVLFIEPGGCPPGLSACPTPELRLDMAEQLLAFAEAEGIDVIDGRPFVSVDDDVWADPAHVNRKGTEIITTALGERLCALVPCGATAEVGASPSD